MPALKKYADAQRDKLPPVEEPTPSGIACTEKGCHGQMMFVQPERTHPELPALRRAVCGECGWRGWC